MQKRLSLCLIVRDEAPRLRGCVESVVAAVDEVVIVDTGSTDGTPALAQELEAAFPAVAFQRLEYPWHDDFSAARNVSLRAATGEWILVLDADERLDAANLQRLQALRNALGRDGVMAYTVRVPGYVTFGQRRDLTLCRLFRNTPRIYYTGRVHESVWASLEALGARVADSGLVIQHRNDLRPLAAALKKDFYYERLRLGEENAHRATWNVLLQETSPQPIRQEDWAALTEEAESSLVERLRKRLLAARIAAPAE